MRGHMFCWFLGSFENRLWGDEGSSVSEQDVGIRRTASAYYCRSVTHRINDNSDRPGKFPELGNSAIAAQLNLKAVVCG